MNGIKIDLSDFARVVYPGILVWLFISWRYPQLFGSKWDASIILLSLVAGVLLYSVYRAVVLYPAIRCLEYKLSGAPEYRFYYGVVDQMRFPKEIKKKLKKMRWAAACATKVLAEAPTDFKDALYKFNSFVHVPLLTSFVASCVFLHDLVWSISRWISHSLIPPCFNGFTAWWLVIWLVASAFFLAIGIMFDCWQSDPRETAFLIQKKEKCKEFIKELADYYRYRGLEDC